MSALASSDDLRHHGICDGRGERADEYDRDAGCEERGGVGDDVIHTGQGENDIDGGAGNDWINGRGKKRGKKGTGVN